MSGMRTRLLSGLLVFACACSASATRGESRDLLTASPAFQLPTRPSPCAEVGPSESLQARIDAAAEGSSLCLRAGRYLGPIELNRRVTLWGPRQAVIGTKGRGTVILMTGKFARVLGITVDGRGGRYDMQDAAIAVRADDAQVRGVRIQNAVFGILSDRANRLTITDNEISGQANVPLGVRGDGIRLWETRHSLIARNHLWDGRDLVVWYSPDNRFEDNLAQGGRYGMHFMHASDNTVTRNRFVGNVVGVFVMYSHQIRIEDSDFVDCSSAGGMGVGIKDSGDVTVRRNRFVHDATGIYVDNSPSTRGESNLIAQNSFRLSDAALVFHASSRGNTLLRNTFASNRDQVLVEGGGDALAATWHANEFDDYAGYDMDGDGMGDVPYEIRSLASSLGMRYPALAFFRGTSASGVVEALGRIIPLFTPRTLIVDARPSMRDPRGESWREN